MRRTPLEVYVGVLAALNERGAVKITHISHLVNLNGSLARDYLDFMVKQRLVEKQALSKKRVAYKITDRGKKVLEYFHMVKEATPQEVWYTERARRIK
jgi:predicted transcriptional regulator